MADPSTLNALQNLNVFDGTPVNMRNRALLQAGLQMLQPIQPGGNALTGIGSGVAAGLQSLDTSRANAARSEQQGFDNRIQERTVSTTEQDTTSKAERRASQTRNEASVADETKRQFNEEAGLRQAEELERRANAAYKDRMPAEAGGTTSEAQNFADLVKTKAMAIWKADQAKGLYGQYTDLNDPFLQDRAMTEAFQLKGMSGNDSLPLVAQDAQEAVGLGQRAGQISSPGTATRTQEPPTQQELMDLNAIAKMGAAEIRELIKRRDPRLELLPKTPRLYARVKQILQEENTE